MSKTVTMHSLQCRVVVGNWGDSVAAAAAELRRHEPPLFPVQSGAVLNR